MTPATPPFQIKRSPTPIPPPPIPIPLPLLVVILLIWATPPLVLFPPRVSPQVATGEMEGLVGVREEAAEQEEVPVPLPLSLLLFPGRESGLGASSLRQRCFLNTLLTTPFALLSSPFPTSLTFPIHPFFLNEKDAEILRLSTRVRELEAEVQRLNGTLT